MASRNYLVAVALGTLGTLLATSGIARADRDDDEEGEFEGDGPEAEEVTEFKLETLIQVAVRHSPDLMRAKTDRDVAKGQAGAARANQQWVMQMGAQYKSNAVGGQVKVEPFGQVQQDSVVGSIALGRNLPTGANIQVELGLGHTTTEIDVPEGLQPAGSAAMTGSTAATEGRIDDHYTRVQTTAKLTLKQPLVRGFGPDIALADEHRADFTAAAETLKAQLAAEDMIREVVSGYWELAFASHEVEIRAQSLALAEAHEKLTREEVRAGQAAQTSLNAVTYEIAVRKEAVLRAQLVLEQKSLELRQKAGLGLGRRQTVMRPGEAFDIGNDEWDIEEVLAQSRKANRKLSSIALQKKAADIDVRVTQNLTLPQVDVSVSGALLGGGNTTSESISAVSGISGYEVMAGLSVQFELSGAAKSNHEAALARRRRLNVDRADAERQIDAQVVTSVKMVTSARTRVALADKAIAVAEENAKAEKLSFTAGKSTNYSVMDRQTQLVEAQLRRGRAVADYHTAVAQLQFLSGSILEQYRVNVRPRGGR